MRHPIVHNIEPADRASTLVDQARRQRRRGETRRALVSLREACMLDENRAAVWCLYGALLGEQGKVDEATRALRQALWLRKRSGDEARVRTTQLILDRLPRLAA